MTPTLIIAGIEVSTIAWLEFDQQIQPIGGSSVRRMADGRAYKLTHWKKHRISLSARGWIPPALLGIDYSQEFEIELPLPIALNDGEVLPDGWSARSAPFDEHLVTDQADKNVRYVYVKMTVLADEPTQAGDRANNRSWELVCETV